jgi:hypothetical protein
MTNRRDGRRHGQAINWPAVRAMYVEGTATDPDGDPNLRTWPRQADVAAAFGISERAIATRSARDGWTAQRDEFQADVDRARREALVAETATKVTSIDRRALTIADAGLSLLSHRVTFLVKAEIDRQQDAGKGVSATEMAALGLAARRWVQVRDAVIGRGAPVDDEGDTERDLRVAEQVLAAKIAQHRAARESDDDDLADV